MNNTNLITFNSDQTDYYSSILNDKLHQIRKLNTMNSEFLSGIWDSNINYRSSFDKSFMELQPKYYQERDKWVDFIFLTQKYN